MLRLPPGMRDRIAAAAKAANRSMNAEIVARLEASFAAPPAIAEDRRQLMLDAAFHAVMEVIGQMTDAERARSLRRMMVLTVGPALADKPPADDAHATPSAPDPPRPRRRSPRPAG